MIVQFMTCMDCGQEMHVYRVSKAQYPWQTPSYLMLLPILWQLIHHVINMNYLKELNSGVPILML